MGRIPTQLSNDIARFKDRLSKKLSLKKMLLFGSYSKGVQRVESDVDIILVSPSFKGKRWIKRAPALYKYWPYNYQLDLLCYTPEEFNRIKKISTVVKEAVKEGVEI